MFVYFPQFLLDFFWFHLIILLVAIIIDLIVGDPPSRLHPVIWIGKLIGFLRSKLRSSSSNTPKKDKLKGILLTFLSLTIFLGPLGLGFWLIKKFLIDFLEIYGILIYILIIGVFLKSSFAIRCLRDATVPIARELEKGNLENAKSHLNMIVRRDPKNLTEELVISAAVESIAESLIDGITSPIFYFFIFNLIACLFNFEWSFLGVLGAVGFRIINTLDSMVGYKTPEYINIGWFSARSDDVFNFIPERMSTIMMLPASSLSRQSSRNALRILKRDRNNVESVNAGWSMACMAGALKVKLEKAGSYQLGDSINKLKPHHINISLKIIYIAFILFLFLMIFLIFLTQYFWFEMILKDVITWF